MEISEIKQKIMAKIEGEKSKSSRKKKPINLATLSMKMGIPEEDVLKLFNKQSSPTATAPEAAEEYETSEYEKPSEDHHANLNALEEENARLKKAQEDALTVAKATLGTVEMQMTNGLATITQQLQAQQAVDVARERYKAGSASYFELLQVQQLLYPAESALAQTRRDELVSLVQLYKALGGGWNLTDPAWLGVKSSLP